MAKTWRGENKKDIVYVRYILMKDKNSNTLNKKKGRKEETENNNYENQFKVSSLVQRHILV